MARIGLVDVDGHNYPNIPLMKLSAWHKRIARWANSNRIIRACPRFEDYNG